MDENRKFDSYPISQEQITIIQSNDRPFSSDESVIEVVSEKHYSSHNDSNDVDCDAIDNKNNPWGNMDVQEIPLDIKHEELDGMSNNTSINSSSSSSSSSPDVIFSPLSNIDRLNAAKKFHIKLRPSDHILSHRGIGFVFKHKPVVTVSANPDGACLFKSISLLLSGSDVYSHVIRHVICNYICAKENHNKLAQHIPRLYTSGKEYVEKERM